MIEFNRSFLGVPVTEDQIIALNEAYQRKIEVQPMTVRRFKFHKDELRDKIIKSELKPVEVRELIKDTVCELTDMSFRDVKGQTRLGANVLARKLIGYFVTEYTPFSLSSIGEYLGLINTYGSGDHTVIIYYRDKIREALDVRDSRLSGWVDEIERELIRKLSNVKIEL
jgi:chromosomal replication initiation ATPase DnaA